MIKKNLKGTKIMMFEDTIRKIIEDEWEDYFLGTADLSDIKDDVNDYESLIGLYPRAISIGLTLPMIVNDKSMNNTDLYSETNVKLNNITTYLSSLLENHGYKALSVPKYGTMSNGIFSSLHSLAAKIANLGSVENSTIAKDETGLEVNWGTVLTNAPIK